MTNEGTITNIKDVKPGQKNLTLMFIVLEIGKPTLTKDGHSVRTVKVADRTGSINMSVWDDIGDQLQTGDICRITKGYGSIWKGCLTLYSAKSGDVHKIGEFCMVFSEVPFMSELNPEFLKVPESEQKSQGSVQRRSPTEQATSVQAHSNSASAGESQPPAAAAPQHSNPPASHQPVSGFHPPPSLGNPGIQSQGTGQVYSTDSQRNRSFGPVGQMANNGLRPMKRSR